MAGDTVMRPGTAAERTISDRTRFFSVLGDPVPQVKAPAMMSRLFTERGVDAALVPAELSPDDLAALSVVEVDRSRAEALVARLDEHRPRLVRAAGGPDPGSDVVVNATPQDLREGDPPPFALDGLRAETVIADIIMKPAETGLLREAAGRIRGSQC